MHITTMHDLQRYVSSITENYDPFNWESQGIDKEVYDDCVAQLLLVHIRANGFNWGDDIRRVPNWDAWQEIESKAEEIHRVC